jgi:hypothetical protein
LTAFEVIAFKLSPYVDSADSRWVIEEKCRKSSQTTNAFVRPKSRCGAPWDFDKGHRRRRGFRAIRRTIKSASSLAMVMCGLSD